jgi:hypothetical protein
MGYLFASLVPGAAGSLVFGAVMVLLKTIADGASHVLEHRRFGAAAGEAGGSGHGGVAEWFEERPKP